MKNQTKSILLVCLASVYLLAFSFYSWIKPSDAFSEAERRALKEFPEMNAETILDASFMSNFESYALDQFPFRDSFRSVKSVASNQIFMQKDVNDLYFYEDHIVFMEYPMNQKSIDYAVKRFDNVYQKYLKDTNTKVYFSIIPDKNYFLAKESGHLAIDYEEFERQFVAGLGFAEYIDITSELTASQYYKTDSHWNQTEVLNVADKLASGMGISLTAKYERVTLPRPFYGVYHGQLARSVQGDTLSYLTNDILENCSVFDYQNNQEISMYDIESAKGKDPYELFLGGPLSLVSIENPKGDKEKELILFRDSFGSSIAPLLVEGYSKITLVDIRYISPAMLENFIEFENQDVLFLYSTSVLNNSSTIK